MEVVSLSRDPGKPCLLIRLDGLTILVDTPLDIQQLFQFLPTNGLQPPAVDALPAWRPPNGDVGDLDPSLFRLLNGHVFVDACPQFGTPDYGLIDVAAIDVVLISNSFSFAGLPFLVAQSGFRARIFATDPTAQIGTLLVNELVELVERVPPGREGSGEGWKTTALFSQFPNPPPSDPHRWRPLFSRASTELLDKVEIIAYKEQMDVYGMGRVTALCSGFSIGSCNWLIHTDFEKIGVVSSSSSLTTHTRALEREGLAGVDALVLTSLSASPAHPPSRSIDELTKTAMAAVAGGGSVLIPVQPTGLVYDLLEVLIHHFSRANLDSVPFYVVGPVAKSMLMYSNIYSEWLSEAKMKLAYLPEDPFPHAANMRSGRVTAVEASWSPGATFAAPAVIFASHPSLRLGCGVAFARLLAPSPNNVLILTDPDFSAAAVLAPYQPLAMKAFSFPIDSRLNFDQAETLVSQLSPKRLIVPQEYCALKPDSTLPFHNDWSRFMNTLQKKIEHGSRELAFAAPCHVDFNRSSRMLQLEPELAAALDIQLLEDGTEVGSVRGTLDSWNNRLVLKKETAETGAELYGALTATQLRLRLNLLGFKDVKVEAESGGDFILALGSGVRIIVDGGQRTRVEFSRYDAKVKAAIQKAVQECLLCL